MPAPQAKDQHLGIRIESDLKDALAERAAELDRSTSWLTADIIRRWFKFTIASKREGTWAAFKRRLEAAGLQEDSAVVDGSPTTAGIDHQDRVALVAVIPRDQVDEAIAYLRKKKWMAPA